MKSKIKVGLVVLGMFLICLATSCTSSSEPQKDFLDSGLKSIAPQGFETSPEIKLAAFIDALANKGKWSKDNDAWIYRIQVVDKVSGNKSDTSMQFINTTHKNNKVVLLNRIATNGEDMSPATVYNLYSQVVQKAQSAK